MAQAHFEPTWAFIKRPSGYPTGPRVGKPELILQYNGNSSALYHRYSPYSNYHQGLLDWGDEPYYYVYPDQGSKFPNSARRYESRLFPLGSAIIDVQRTVKFLISGRGVTFLAKQFLLQTAQPYNETRIYNPTSPVVAAGMTLTLGAARPARMFDTSAGLAGIASSLLGSVGSAIFGPPKTNPVSGTTLVNNQQALPTATLTTGTKGLLRAGDALRAKTHLEQAWQGKGSKRPSLLGMLTSMFQNFIPQTQTAKYRSDEHTYGLMLGSGQAYFTYKSRRGGIFDFHQLFQGGGDITNPDGNYPGEAARIFINFDGTPKIVKVQQLSSQGAVDGKAVGYSVDESTDKNSPGYRYGDAMKVGDPASRDYQNSDIMIQYKYYTDQKFPTKDPDAKKSDVQKINETLKNTIKVIRAASEGTYKVDDAEPGIIREGKFTYDYDRLIGGKKQTNGKPSTDQPLSALAIYRNTGIKMVTRDISRDANNSLKMASNGTFDALNVLNVLDKSKSTGSPIPGWSTWDAYRDDSIAVFFYDVVNDKYIPFRSAIKGLSESGNASWEELPFIGRADKVYSYGGFNRNASFTLKIVINSIKELAPTWQRINYINTAYKPANYTKAPGGSSRYDRFMVPPMFFLTLGDFYKDQPILIQSVVTTIPEDALWETQNEDNNSGGWDYMGKLISASGAKYGQIPRDVELAFTVTLLEKERAVVGGANFGHAPRDEDFKPYNTDTPNGKNPNEWNSNLLVNVIS